MKSTFKSITRRIILKSFARSLDFFNVFKYSFLFLIFLTFNNLETEILPYSSAVLTATLSQGGSLFISPLIFILSFLIVGKNGLLASAGIFALIMTITTAIYRKFKKKLHFESLAYSLIGLLGFIFLGDTTIQIDFYRRLITSGVILMLSFICLLSARAVNEKGLKFKLGFEEFCSIALSVCAFGIGVSNLISPFLFKGISVFILLLSCYLYRSGIATIVSGILGVSLAVYYNDLNYVSIFIVWALVSESLMPFSRYVSALSVILTDYIIYLCFGIYQAYILGDFLPVLIGAICFSLLPTTIIRSIKEKLYSFREKQLVRKTINRNRTILSGRLFDLSGVFTEMSNAFNLFKEKNLSENGAKKIMKKEIISSVCNSCANYNKCKKYEQDIKLSVDKMIDIGFAKGKLSLIDMPAEFSSRCTHPSNVLYGLNKMLCDFRNKLIENANLSIGRELIASEAMGIAEILRGLALESGTLLKYHSRLERLCSENLFKAGFLVNELLIFGDEDRLSVSLITVMKEVSIEEMSRIISKTLGINVELCEKAFITDEKCYLSFRKATEYDAVFGISKVRKDRSPISGDTHSVTRIAHDKFLFALSDGMGSGEHAQNVSSASLSLIESFYKAGLKSELILNTVNKLLSINTEDSFSALDISVIDLNNRSVDFIKYGSPYGFIISESGIKIVEGNTLPLGIIDDLKPSVASTVLENDDVILLVTDGVSDAFGSSGEIIDFLRSLTVKNPQALTDQVINKALSLSNGEKKDDMTALAVRIYKKTA